MDYMSSDDMYLFNEAQRQVSEASWVNQDVVLTHNLVPAISMK